MGEEFASLSTVTDGSIRINKYTDEIPEVPVCNVVLIRFVSCAICIWYEG